jgi:iron complex transport system substrate-binding protein
MKELIKSKFGVLFSLFFGFLFLSCNLRKNNAIQLGQSSNICTKSKHLSIEKNGNGFLVTTRYDISSKKTQNVASFFLAKSKPKTLASDVMFIQIPIKSGVFLASSHIGMMYELGLENLICGISRKQFLCKNPKHIRQIEEFMDLSGQGIERLISTKTSLVMYSGFDSKPILIEKLEKINTPCIPNYDWREETPLGRAEWIKLFGILNGKELQAENLFKTICANYNALKSQTSKITKKPSVFAGGMIGDVWYSPGGSSFMAQLFEDAGANYSLKNQKVNASISFTFEKAFGINQSIDYWINDGAINLQDLAKENAKYKTFGAFKNKKVFGNKSTSNCFWERSAVRPDLVLKDFIQLFHPELKTTENTYYFSLK